MGVLACPPTTEAPGHSGVAEGSTGCPGNKPTPICRYEKRPGPGRGMKASRPSSSPGVLSSYPASWDLAGCPMARLQDKQIQALLETWDPATPPRGRAQMRLAGGRPSYWLWSALTTSLSPRLPSAQKDRPRRPPTRAGDLRGGGGGLAQEQSCPQAAGQRVPGGRRRRSGGARRVREVWAAVRPQLPPGPAPEPIATTRRRRQLPLPTPYPERG